MRRRQPAAPAVPTTRAAFAVAVACAAAACADGSATSASSGEPSTHQETSVEEAEIRGVLGGTSSCLWLDVGGDRHALVLPAGSTTRLRDGAVVLVDADGRELAETGDRVVVGGGFRDEGPSCEGTADRAIFVGPLVRVTG